jgi:FMN phosphatase YigB (HAD superfamily)
LESVTVRAVLFDLDGTLLDIEIDTFIRKYFEALGPVVAGFTGRDARTALDAVTAGTEAMFHPHPDSTNAQAFTAEFERHTGVTMTPEHWEALDRFYREVFPTLRGSIGPAKGARRTVEAARDAGCAIAVATNPIFPLAAIEERIRWAGLGDIEFAWVTSYETSSATKPHGAYYREVAERLGVDPSECLMVGDDPMLDMPAADTGMQTYYCGRGKIHAATYCGTIGELAGLLPRLCAR